MNLKVFGLHYVIGKYDTEINVCVDVVKCLCLCHFVDQNAWSLYDKDNSGALSGFELRQALNSAGYRLNNRVLNVIMHRYGNKNGEIQFDDFMLCAIKLKTMMGSFLINKYVLFI